jgi:hypothetical protein
MKPITNPCLASLLCILMSTETKAGQSQQAGLEQRVAELLARMTVT